MSHIENDVKILSDREHVLKRPSMYIGSINYTESEQYTLNKETNKFEKQVIKVVPGLLKIVNEIIDNSIDEGIRTNFEFANKINITIEENKIQVTDNGRGIPLKYIGKIPMAVVAFTQAKAGANFHDEGRESIGANGVGSFCTACYSTEFRAISGDGKKYVDLKIKNNLADIDFETKEEKHVQGTSVTFSPDYSKFEGKIDELHIEVIKQRLRFLSMSYPKIVFNFNGELIKHKDNAEFVKQFGDNAEVFQSENWFFAVLPSDNDEFNHFSYVNGLFMKSGGNHIDFIANAIVYPLRNHFIKKYKNIKLGDIRNKLTLIVFLKKFPNAKFDSQTKEKLTNSITEIRDDYLKWDDALYQETFKRITKNAFICDPITEFYRLKEEYAKRKLLEERKPAKKVKYEKYYPPIGEKKYLCLTEGDSACNSISKILGRKGFGYFALKGVIKNIHGMTPTDVLKNKELQNLVDVLNMNLKTPSESMEFENILFATDQDLDGAHIRGLLLSFFHRFAKPMLEAGKIKILDTPIIVAREKEKLVKWWYSFEEYNSDTKKKESWNTSYMKGLGSWKDYELRAIMEKDGEERMFVTLSVDDAYEDHLDNWMNRGLSNERKNYIEDRPFDLFML